MNDNWDRIARLSPEKRALLMMQLQKKSVSAPPPRIVPQRNGAKPTALSFAQQRLWFLDQLEPGKSVYNLAGAIRLTGLVDIAALTQSFNEIVRRHETLRTTFREIDGEPFQIIAPSLVIPMRVEDLSGLAKEDVARLAAEEARIPFDLIRGPLLRIRLLKLGDLDHVLLFTMHHIVSDGWSIGVLTRELSLLYDAFSEKKSSPLSDLPIQYADFAKWQRDHLQGESLEKTLSYWTRQLTGAPAVIDLPSDRPRPREQSSRGAKQSLWLSEELSAALTSLSQSSGATLFMILLAAFKTLLYRYTGVEDVVVGIPISGRNQAETRELIGLFVNTLALRTRLSGKLTFRELLERVRETSLGAYDHADLPFETLTERLRPQRSLSHTPLFQVMFVLQNAPYDSLSLRNISLTPLSLDTGVALYDLTLTAIDADGKLKLSLEYNLDLFDHSTTARMLENLQRLLEGIVANPDQRLSVLPLLTEAETQRLLVELNQAPDADPPVLCVHQLFEEQVTRTPGAVALVGGDDELTYAELNRRANQLAHYLRQLGVEPESRVAILMERSVEMIVSVLAVLKAGGAYVPLEPHYPAERLIWMLSDSQSSLLLTKKWLGDNVPPMDARMVCVDTEEELISQQREFNPEFSMDTANLAYLIYTSGSTGQPKAVAITHRSLVNYSTYAQGEFNLSVDDRVLQFASLSFDTSAEEIFPTLTSGATLVLRSLEMSLGASSFLKSCEERGITVLDLPTAYWNELVSNATVADWAAAGKLRLVIIGGEKALPDTVQKFGERVGAHVSLKNGYGPTEVTIVATFTELLTARDGQPDNRGVSIGRPIRNARTYVLDKQMQVVPVGVVGELYVGGAGVARGYLNRPEISAEKFLPDPFAGEAGARMYRTGDLVKWRSDGELEYIDRADQQVKVRGFRVELGEIEAVLRGNEAVHDVVVMARDNGAGDKRLVAYVIAEADMTLSTTDLRGYVQNRLPDYMVPSSFIMLIDFPLTTNGKINRAALPEPDNARPELADIFVAPRTPMEEKLAAIWESVLGISGIGIHDNFFELGGHSLLATRVVSRIRKATQLDLPLRLIFDAPTVAGLADRIDAALRTNPRGSLTPIERADRARELPLSFAQQRLWFLDQMESGSPSYNMHVAIRLTGALDTAVLDRSLAEIIRRHESLRTNFATVEGRPVQVIHPALDWRLKVVSLKSLDESEREAAAMKLIAEEARQPFDLSNGTLLRGILLQLEQQQQVLMLTMHHIISDAWSISVLVREVLALYKAFSAGQPSPLPELEIQYADFALWQRDWLQDETLENELSYWRDRLHDPVACIDLPTDRPRPAVQTYRGAAHTLTIPGDLADQIRQLSRREGATLFMVLLAAFKVLLHRYSGQNDILVGTPIANRDRAELESLIGFFLNTLVLRTDVSGNPTFKQLLAQVREVAVGAYAHQGLPFEKILEELQPERNLSHTPLFQVWFNLLNAELDNIDFLPDTTVEPVSAPIDQSKFDLSLLAAEQTDGIRLQFIYNTDLFDASTITAMAGHFRNLLEAIAADPNQRIAAIPLLSDPQLREIRTQQRSIPRSKSFAEFAREDIEQSIPDRFAAQVRLHPNRTAVKTPNYEWTYSELNARSDAIAQTALTLLGPAPERVALLLERDTPIVAGILGALKAGKTYVPLDPYYPAERIAYMLEDSEAAAILTNNKNLPFAQTLAKDHVRIINLDEAEVVGHPTFPDAAPDSFAYILYTSGSTGRPKGVIQNHRNVLHFIRNYTNNLAIGPEDKLSLLSSYCFDAAIMDIFGALLNGAALLPFDLRQDGLARFTGWMIEQGITIYHSTPTVYRYLLRSLSGQEQFPSLRLVVLGGEAVYKRDVEEYQRRFGPQCIFVNGLGPTESTLGLQFVINGNTRINRNAVPVGYPVEDTQIVLLDEAGAPGAIRGEIGIRSKHLALGYWNQEDLTRCAFLPDPHGDGMRIYKTGDIGRLLPDGALEFIGRNDTQIKIRGYRVEIAEIEALLAEHDSVKEAVVTASEEQPGEQRLAAYIVNKNGCEVSVQELQQYLKDRLPDYMAPAVLTMVNEIPLTPSGKVDRTRLPVPEFTLPADDEDIVAPSTPVQEVLETIWTDLLQIKRAGLYDNFFALGGHSLLAAQVVARIRDVFSIDLPLRAIFENSTLIELSRVIASRISQANTSTIPTIKKTPRDEPLPLTFSQQRAWFLEQLEPGASVYNIPFAATLTGRLDRTALERAFREIARRHEVLRTTFVEIAGKPTQLVAEFSEIGVAVFDLIGLDESNKEAEARQIIKEESELPFNLSTGPLMRVTLLRLAKQQHILLVVMHHIISDGWSIGVLLKELAALYEAFCRGEESPLKQLQLQYGDYAVWQRDWLKTEVLDQQLRYWKENLGQEFPALELPTDRMRPAVRSHAGAQERLEISEDLSYELREASRREGVTLFMLLLGAFQVLLHRYSGQDEILVGTATSNRRDVLLEEMIGFFANTVVLRGDLSGDPTFREFLRQVRETTLNAYAHQDIPFEMLVEELQPERDMSRNPIFQTMVVLQNTPRPRLELSELTLSGMRIESSTAKFDLLLSIAETKKGLMASLEYNSDLFASETILRMLSHFATLLQSIVRNPEYRVSELDYLSDAERTKLLYEWNQYQAFPHELCIHRLFEQRVERTPEAIAVTFNGSALDYGELNRRANKLAHYLRRMGVEADVVVGIAVERSLEMIIGLLGILKAGGAYVPIDPAYPQQRIAFMLEDANITVLLTQRSLLESLPGSQATIVCIDSDWERIEQEGEENLTSEVLEDNLAYVIYTSGSTGRPKGVLVTHANMVRLLTATQAWFNFDSSDVWTLFHSYAFDFSVWEIWGALLYGGRLVVVPYLVSRSPQAVYQLLSDERVTILNQTPSAFHQLMQVDQASPHVELPALRLVIFGGEALDLKSLAPWFDQHSDELPRLVNMYGITETTVHVTLRPLSREDVEGVARSRIGVPISDMQLYILDRHLQPVPINVAGEMYVGGAGVSRGYLNRPDLTAERFIPNPFGRQPGTGGDRCFQQLFEAQVRATPGKVAVEFNNESLTYDLLNRRANRLARLLIEQGVGPDVVVALFAERSIDLLTAILAVFKAGGAYLPLDPNYPAQRIAQVLEQSGAPLVLTTSELTETLSQALDAMPRQSQPTLRVIEEELAREVSEEDLEARNSPRNLAYVIYTSGSTGVPKGAMVEQVGMVNHLYAKVNALALTENDIVAQNASQCFDISVWQMLVSLLVGGRVRIIPNETAHDPSMLLDEMKTNGITVIETVPSLLRAMLKEIEQRGPAAPALEQLRWMVATGEALPPDLCTQWLQAYPGIPIMNAYGPTECSDDVTHHPIDRDPGADAVRMPIGRPVDNTSIFILNHRQQPAPIGITGEIYVAGVGVGRGYLNDPERTADVFVPNSLTAEAGNRLYRTGDLARRLANGDVEYLGRLDQQVKIRGFRIELAEIESVLGQHPEVKDCAVIMGQGPNGDRSLLAYVVPYQQKATIRSGELRAFLRQTLPEYMIPSRFSSLEEIPLTSNGKLDRKSLPAPRQNRGDLGSYVAPRNLVEQAMAGIWSQVLQVDRVGIHDNFFALGGHSLLATQLLSRLRHVLNIEVPLRKLFESPTIGELALSERDLQRDQGQEITAIQRVTRTGPLPLSFAQERLWFLDQFEPASSFYSIPMALRLTGSLDIDALQWTLNEVERRHESLRTVFASSEGKPFQQVLEPRGIEIQVTELEEIAARDPGRRIQEALLREVQRGFSLALGPLMRVNLIRLSHREHLLLIVMHHIICDAWSLGLLVREVSSLYRSHLSGEQPELEELPVQYGDYALWQREWLQGEVLEQQLDYWKQKLDGHPAVLELASDRPRPAIQSYRGAKVRQEIPAGVTSELQRMARDEGVTLFMLLLAGFEVLLHRYTAKEDLCVGTPIAGRNRFETESVVGLFVNTLVMRVDLSGEPSFSELLGRVRDVVIGAFTNQDVPFEKLVEELNPERSMSHSPLFQVMFALQNAEAPIPPLPDLTLEPVVWDTATAKFDLGLDVYEGQQNLVCTFEYNTDLFDESTIKRLASHYQTLLESIVADPSRHISDLPLLSEAEQQQLVSGWNDTEREYAHELCVNELFEAQAESNPDGVAVAFENLTITYGELNSRSNQLAHFLRGLGVGPDMLVGIYLERSTDVLVAVFGILKAGGAYVPLDAAYPKERIAQLVEDSRLTIVVTQHRLSAELPPFVQHAVCLDRDWQAISEYSVDSPPQVASPDNLAYAVYTSGSTGKPKGVMISHRSLVNAFQAWRESYRLDSDCKTHLQMASISFDVFAGDLVRALCSGGTLILCPREFLLEPEKLYELMLQQRVDVAEFVPAVVRQLIDYVAKRGLSLEFMKLLVVGSDIWNVWEFEQLKTYCGDTTRVINSYGVSEATVDSSYFESTQIQLSPGGLVPIGWPFGHTSLHVLDSKFRLAPVGVAGELCIGGLGLARGYLNQPRFTAEKFVPNPFCKNGGSRLYRTGDWVRRLADGTIEFLGRLDNQIKIRGFRIELGEIEAALSEHTGVREAVVMAREAGPGNNMLVAYIVPQNGRPPGAAELRRFLKESLPEHMIPSAFVEMERMPLSANGKLDRRALPAPRSVRPELEQSFVAPRNKIEETINAIWVEVLKIDRIGVNDSFFELGGHSLLATQVASRLRKAFEIEIPLRSLFENPTIAELGETVDALISNGQRGELQSITPAPRDKPLQLSFAQERLWFLNRLQPDSPFYNTPTAVRLFGMIDIQALERSLAEVTRRHEVLRTTFPTVDGAPTLLISPPQPVSVRVIDINNLPALEREARAKQLINEEVRRSFDLERGPLMRAVLLRFAEQDHVLVFTTHHIVSDAWSMDVLVREAVTLYEAFANNRPSPLADLAIQYTDFTAWQREWIRGEVLDAHLDYWKKQLSGAPLRLRLPMDRPRSSAQAHRGKRLTLPLSPSLLGPLKELTSRSGTTLFMGLLAAFQTLLYRYTGQDDIVVGTAIAGRGRAEIEGLIGFFINMLVMRTSLSGTPRFVDLLSRVKETALGAYAHQDLPFEKLVEVLQPQRDPGVSPLFQVAFGLQNTPMPQIQLPGLEVRPVAFQEETVRYDLTLWIWELTDGLTAGWTYSTDLFDESTIRRMHQHYDALLLNIVAHPEERVNALEMLTEAERKQRAVAEEQSHDLKLESLRTSRRTAVSAERV